MLLRRLTGTLPALLLALSLLPGGSSLADLPVDLIGEIMLMLPDSDAFYNAFLVADKWRKAGEQVRERLTKELGTAAKVSGNRFFKVLALPHVKHTISLVASDPFPPSLSLLPETSGENPPASWHAWIRAIHFPGDLGDTQLDSIVQLFGTIPSDPDYLKRLSCIHLPTAVALQLGQHFVALRSTETETLLLGWLGGQPGYFPLDNNFSKDLEALKSQASLPEGQDFLKKLIDNTRAFFFPGEVCDGMLNLVLRISKTKHRYIGVGKLFTLHPECTGWWNKKPLHAGAVEPAAFPKSLAAPNARIFDALKGQIEVAITAYKWGIRVKVHAEDVAVAAVEDPGEALSRLCKMLEERPWRQEFEQDQMIHLTKEKLAEKWTPELEIKTRQCGRKLIPRGLAGA